LGNPARVSVGDAFAYYVGMGAGRSYASVAERYGVRKRAITFLAKRYRWAEKLREIEEEADRRLRESQIVSIVEARERHLKSLRALQAKALTGLRDNSVRTVGEAARALEAAIKLERLILGETTSRTSVSIEEREQREVDQLINDEDTEESDMELDGIDTDDVELDATEALERATDGSDA